MRKTIAWSRTCKGAWSGFVAVMVSGLVLPFAAHTNEVQTPTHTLNRSQLTIKIDGLKQQKGQTCFSLFNRDSGFPTRSDAALRTECIAVRQVPQTIQLKDLQPGRYAIAVLHDLNGDREANRNVLGMPTEGFGFSRNPKIGFKAPRFEEAAIAVKGKQTQIQIRLNYLL